jgi:hypothetical protein
MPRSFKFAAMAIALTALTPPAFAGGAEEIMRLCSQPDSQMSGGQVAFCHAFWKGVEDALKHPATPVAMTPPTPVPATPAVVIPPIPAPATPAHPTPTPAIVKPTASLRPGEIPLDQGPAREIPIDQGPAREISLDQGPER